MTELPDPNPPVPGIGEPPAPSRATSARRLPAWALPAIVLGVIALGAAGAAIGMAVAGGGPTATTIPVTTTAASAEGACVAQRIEEGHTADEAAAICSNLEVGSPTVTGDALPEFDTPENDTALGLTIPEVQGADFAGAPVAITRDGRAKVLIFFAHWCSVCRQEIPTIADWMPTADLPESVDFISVSTGVRIDRPNYPPSQWLESEGWAVPVILDDAVFSVSQAFGLNAYPYFVFVDAGGRVVGRIAGGLPTETLAEIVTQLAEG
jgi:thiol-disulfide isomerase/thioredoxin